MTATAVDHALAAYRELTQAKRVAFAEMAMLEAPPATMATGRTEGRRVRNLAVYVAGSSHDRALVASFNALAAEYNAASSKFNWTPFKGSIPETVVPYSEGSK